MQLSLFDEEPQFKQTEKKAFYVTIGLFTDKIKYGRRDNIMPNQNRYENREDVIRILMKNDYTRSQAEEMIQKAYEHEENWYAYKESFYIF